MKLFFLPLHAILLNVGPKCIRYILSHLDSTLCTVSSLGNLHRSRHFTCPLYFLQPRIHHISHISSHLVHPSPAWSFLTSPSFRIRFYLFSPHCSAHLSRFPAQEILLQLLSSVFKSVLLSTPLIFVLCSFLHYSCSNNVSIFSQHIFFSCCLFLKYLHVKNIGLFPQMC